MQLRKSVALYKAVANDPVEDRVTVSHRTGSANSLNHKSATYFDWAIVPSAAWLAPTPEEINLLVTEKRPENYSASVALVKIPDVLLAPFQAVGLDRVKTREEFYACIQSAEGNAAVEGVANFVRSLLKKEDEFRIIRIFNEPGLPTTAYVHEVDRYVGLHVDNLRGQSAFRRENTANRISINLGNEDRYIIYVNLTMNDLIEIMKPAADLHPDELVLSFLRANPDYPVVRVKIRPGEAYIAPTQNLIHDGIGSAFEPDFNLTICGHIGIPHRA